MPIPRAKLKDRIAHLCEEYGRLFIGIEDSYIIQASFSDADYLSTYAEKPHNWKLSGKRIKRGLYGTVVNLWF